MILNPDKDFEDFMYMLYKTGWVSLDEFYQVCRHGGKNYTDLVNIEGRWQLSLNASRRP